MRFATRHLAQAEVPAPSSTPFTTHDGHTLVQFDWPVPPGTVPRGVVVVCHGLGEHAWRYDALAVVLARAGWAVRACDQRGHGESAGRRGQLPTPDALLLDLQAVLEDAHASLCTRQRLPLVLLGQGLGGLVGALWHARQPKGPVQRLLSGLVLSSPALALRWPGWQRAVLPLLSRALPHATLPSGLDARRLSHQPEVVAAYRADPLVHDRLSLRLAHFMASGGPEVLAHAPRWPLATLLVYASQDGVVDARGSARLARLAPAGVVKGLALGGSRHEVFNDVARDQALAALLAWLEGR